MGHGQKRYWITNFDSPTDDIIPFRQLNGFNQGASVMCFNHNVHKEKNTTNTTQYVRCVRCASVVFVVVKQRNTIQQIAEGYLKLPLYIPPQKSYPV
jgi:hypothetical protein